MDKNELSLDNILTEEDISSLFEEDSSSEDNTSKKEEIKQSEDNEDNEDKRTTEVDVNNLFSEPESVGRKKNTDEEDADSTKDETSPNFYSSIATALVGEGIFPDSDEEELSNIESPEDFKLFIEKQISKGIEDANKRVLEALNAGLEPSEIQYYERTINYLDSLDNDTIEDESENGENLRKNLIIQDYLNRGFSKERALKEVEKSFKAGTDIEDAKEALNSNKEFFEGKYSSIIEKNKREEAKEAQKQKEEAEQLRKSLLESKNLLGDIEIDKNIRQRAYENITKPVYKDPNSGELLTAVQKYQRENRVEFSKNLGLLFTLTNGFKDIDSLVKSKVKKEVKKGLRELEHSLTNTNNPSSGNIRFAYGDHGNTKSFSNGLEIDI